MTDSKIVYIYPASGGPPRPGVVIESPDGQLGLFPRWPSTNQPEAVAGYLPGISGAPGIWLKPTQIDVMRDPAAPDDNVAVVTFAEQLSQVGDWIDINLTPDELTSKVSDNGGNWPATLAALAPDRLGILATLTPQSATTAPSPAPAQATFSATPSVERATARRGVLICKLLRLD